MSNTCTKYILTEKSRVISHSTLLTLNDGEGPVVQALNIGHKPYPLPATSHTEYISKDFCLLDVSKEFLESLEMYPGKMGQPMVVNTRFWWGLYGLGEGPKGEWAYNWKLKDNLPVVQRGITEFFIDPHKATPMVSNLQAVYLCLKEIGKHRAFIPGTLLPTLLNPSNLWRQDLSSHWQVQNLLGIAQVAFCSVMAFVNVTVYLFFLILSYLGTSAYHD